MFDFSGGRATTTGFSTSRQFWTAVIGGVSNEAHLGLFDGNEGGLGIRSPDEASVTLGGSSKHGIERLQDACTTRDEMMVKVDKS